MPSGRPGMTAARSPSVISVSSALTRMYIFCAGLRASSICLTMPRAATLPSGAMESSRSRISASAAVFLALSKFRTLSPGTNRRDRIALRLRLAEHQPGTAAGRHHLAALVGHGVLELDKTLPWPRLARALGNDFCVRPQGIAVEHRLGKFDLGHTQIANGGAERGVIHAHADHDAERVEAVEQPLAELGLPGELGIEMQRLRIHGQQAEQGVVHLGHGAGEFMVELLADHKLLEIKPCHLASLVVRRPLLDERVQPFLTVF